jgi:hypothetical protein
MNNTLGKSGSTEMIVSSMALAKGLQELLAKALAGGH